MTNVTFDLKIIIENKIQLKQLNKAASDEIFLKKNTISQTNDINKNK